MQKALLAIDVGGSTSRAVLVDESGTCLGLGRSRGGNPASNTTEQGALAIVSAVEAAVADADGSRFDIPVALIGLAGPPAHVAMDRLKAAFAAIGLDGPIILAGDLLAMFASSGPSANGYCVLAGTGAGAVRIRDGEIDRVVDANGWLVGDLGSGYWLGLQAAKAVVADLDGRGEKTAMTPAILDAYGIPNSDCGWVRGRPETLGLLTDAIYAGRAIDLARFAPLVIANRTDPVAARLIAQATDYLIADFREVFDPQVIGPVAVGGGVIAHLSGLQPAIGDIIREVGLEPDIQLVEDGTIGAVVLAMRAVGIPVDEVRFKLIASSLAEKRARKSAA